MWWWLVAFCILLFIVSPILAEIVLSAFNKESQVIPFLLFYTVPIGAAALLVEFIVYVLLMVTFR